MASVHLPNAHARSHTAVRRSGSIPLYVTTFAKAMSVTVLMATVSGCADENDRGSSPAPAARGEIELQVSPERVAAGEKLQVRLRNDANEVARYGLPYRIDRLVDGKWTETRIAPRVFPDLELVTMPAGLCQAQTISLPQTAAPGHYRIVKGITNSNETFRVWGRFEIES